METKIIEKTLPDINFSMSFDINNLLICFKDTGWHVSDISMLRKEIVCGCKEKVVTICYKEDNELPNIVFRNTVDGPEASNIMLSPKEMAMFSSLLMFDFKTLGIIFFNMNEV